MAGVPVGGPGGSISFLKQALTEAGAPTLSSAQEEQLDQLISSYRESMFPSSPDENLVTARSAFQESVLSGDLTGAKAAAATLAKLQTAAMQERLEGQAAFMIQAMAILSRDQVNKLVAEFETAGLFELFQRLAGPGMGRRGPGGPGFAPPM